MHAPSHQRGAGAAPRIPAWLGLGVFLAVAVVFLWTEHRAHLLGAAFWGLLLLCPLMHALMHGGHGSHGGGHGRRTDQEHDMRDREEP